MLKRISNALYILYRPLLGILIVFDTALLGSLSIVTSFIDKKGDISYYIVGRFWSRLNLFLSGVKVAVEGKDFITKGQPYIVMANHQSHYDVWALIAYIPIQIRWVMKIELRSVPVFGYCCEKMGHIYIDRADSAHARKHLEAAVDKIKSGTSVFFFPEGTRSLDGRLLTFKKGGFVMALSSGVPILPVTVVGGKHVLPKNTIMVKPGRIKLIIHEPITVEGYTYETKEALMDRVRKIFQEDLTREGEPNNSSPLRGED